MLFADILDIHKSFRPKGSNADILGDGYLLESNSVYRRVKSQVEKVGGQFVEADSAYLLLPFQSLPRILQEKKVPYVPGARLMREVEQSHPGVFSVEDLPIPESYHLHEASHLLAEHFLKGIKAATPAEKILRALLAESFANTVDALACVPVHDEVHYFFLKQNCYMHPQKKNIEALNRVHDSLGFQFLFRLTYLSYLHANFLAAPLSKKQINELREEFTRGCKVGAKLQKDIQTVSGLGEKLDPLFRVTTTGNFLKQMGFSAAIEENLDFPFRKLLEKRVDMGRAIEAMSAAVEF